MKTQKFPSKHIFIIALTINLLSIQSISAHCQIPCGIYNDHHRLLSMLEDAKTIEKSMNEILRLAGSVDAQSQNQLVRWIMNKEKHAQNIITTIGDYYLTQRVKPSQEDYSVRLANHHKVIIDAMKTKQEVNVDKANDLSKSINALREYYIEHKH